MDDMEDRMRRALGRDGWLAPLSPADRVKALAMLERRERLARQRLAWEAKHPTWKPLWR